MFNKKIKSATLLLEVIENDGKTSYLLRAPQNGQLVSVCSSSSDLVTFLSGLLTENLTKDE